MKVAMLEQIMILKNASVSELQKKYSELFEVLYGSVSEGATSTM